MDTTELVLAAKRGNNEAFYQLVSSHKVKLYRIALGYLKNEEDALEAVQEATYRAYSKLYKLKEPRFFHTWLVRILMNYCLSEIKRHRRETVTDSEPESTENKSELYASRLVLETAIDTLEPKYRKVVILKFFEDWTIREIADTLGRPESTIKTWLYKALKDMRSQFQEEGENRV